MILDDPLKVDTVIDAAYDRLLSMERLGGNVFSLTAEQLVQEGVCDPVRAFIKMEPHKRTKLDQGKYRLISGLSIVDQIVDRMLFCCQNELEIANWDRIPSKPGIGLDDDGLRVMAKWFREVLESGRLVSTDVSGWDWAVKEWLLQMDLEARTRLCDGSGSLWHFYARCRYLCVSRKCFVLPDGSLIAQAIDGIMASGWYNTSSTNSRMRAMLRLIAYLLSCSERGVEFDSVEAMKVVAMGDDAVESELDDRSYEVLSELGFTVKDRTVFSSLEGVEFCSHQWYADGLARPVNWVKTLYRFASHPADPLQLPGWMCQLFADFRNMRGVGDSELREVIAEATGRPAKDGH